LKPSRGVFKKEARYKWTAWINSLRKPVVLKFGILVKSKVYVKVSRWIMMQKLCPIVK
jgi:hypothetical protein